MKFKKRILIPVIAIIAILLIGIGTNPSKEDYTTWANEQLMSRSDNELEKGLIGLMGESVINSYTTSKNFVVFSIYDTTIDSSHNIKVLGIFKNFIPIGGNLDGYIN